MKLKLPRTLGTRNHAGLFALAGEIARTNDAKIELDASELEFIDPHGLTVLGALLSPLKDRNIYMPWLRTEFAGYLDRMDFFKHCEICDVEIPDWQRHPHPESLVELTCVTDSTKTDEIANRLADAITGRLTSAAPDEEPDDEGKNKYARFRYPLWYSLSELLENSVTHAKQHGYLQSNVWVAAQYYEKNKEVKMSVVDNGCGFLRSLYTTPELRDKTHANAIRTALKERVSCNRNSPYIYGHGNQGVGLTTTMRIANGARGKLMIASGNAYLETEHMRDSLLPDEGLWNGVAIAFSCRRHALPGINVRRLLPETEVDLQSQLNFV